MEKYLYLREIEWVDVWINGGLIPINLASTYLNLERNGIYTPDENLIHDSQYDLNRYASLISMEKGGGIISMNASENFFNDQEIPSVSNASYYTEDGIILSFCNSFSVDIAKKLNKKACVKIQDVESLKMYIDTQLSCKGIMASCEYTESHNRNHFLKSINDQWQDEYRIFWPLQCNKLVEVPKFSASLVEVFCA